MPHFTHSTVAAALLLLVTSRADAALVVTGSVGGAPTGVSYETFGPLSLGSASETLPS